MFKPIESTSWVSERIAAMDEVTSTKVISEYIFGVDRPNLPSFNVSVCSVALVKESVLAPLLDGSVGVSFAVNVPKHGKWHKSAIDLAKSKGIAFGSMGDLMSAIGHELWNIAQFKKKENAFVELILKQHSRVTSIEQESERVYNVRRKIGQPLRVVLLNEYELTGTCLRSAVEEYGSFDLVLMTNPSGSATSDARTLSKELKIPILTSSQLLGKLNVP